MKQRINEGLILVSVIVPVYNVAPFLSEALNSVINQSYTDLEIIIIDDGSTDGSSDICDEFANMDDRISIIHQDNKGLSAARNVGLDMMNGDAVAFLDSDDAYHPDFIKMMVEELSNDVDLVIGKFIYQYTSGKLGLNGLEKTYPAIDSGIYDKKDILQAFSVDGRCLSLWNKLYKQSLWKDIRFRENHNFEEDIIFEIVDLCNLICVIDEPLYLYRVRSGSITSTFSYKNNYDRLLFFAQLIYFVKSHSPVIYTEKQSMFLCQSWLNKMIKTAIRCSSNISIDENSKAFENLRQIILTNAEEIGIKKCNLRTKITYQMIRFCPHLLRFSYTLYHSARVFIKKGFKR